jgi:hypothetical protein
MRRRSLQTEVVGSIVFLASSVYAAVRSNDPTWYWAVATEVMLWLAAALAAAWWPRAPPRPALRTAALGRAVPYAAARGRVGGSEKRRRRLGAL